MNLRPRISLFALISLLLSASMLATHQQEHQEELASPKLRIDWTEFKKLYDADKLEVVDIRSKDGYRLGHIPGARSVPLDEVEARADQLRKLKKPIVTYCACPGEDTSARAALTLQKKGIDARALIGGYQKWVQVEGRVER